MEQLDKRFQVAQWIAEDLSGIIEEEHARLLLEWRRESATHEAEYQELLAEFNNKNTYRTDQREFVEKQWRRFTSSKKTGQIFLHRYLRYVAVFILLLGSASIMYRLSQAPMPKHNITTKNTTVPQPNVLLILSDGQVIPLNDSLPITFKEPQKHFNISNKTIHYTQQLTKEKQEKFNTLVVPKGAEYKIILADSTAVWLNSESELCYPIAFTGDCRKVHLKGEAYFEVTSDAHKPFIVSALDGVSIKVLGTRFNITSYANDTEITTTLAEGYVEICRGNETIGINPDEQLLFNRHTQAFIHREVDARNSFAWKEGLFIFENQTLEQIMRQLQRWFQIEVVYMNEKVKQVRFSGDLKKYDDFEKIIQLIKEVSGLSIQVKNNCVTIGTK